MLPHELTERDRRALVLAVIVILVTLVTFGLVLPYRRTLDRLEHRLAAKEQQVRQLKEKLAEFQRLRASSSRRRSVRGKQPPSLIAFVEATAIELAAQEKLVALRPQQIPDKKDNIREAVEVKFERIRLDQLVRFLYRVETAPGRLQATRMRIRTRFDDPSLLDAVLVLTSYGEPTP